MRRRPADKSEIAFDASRTGLNDNAVRELGLVFSGGGSRAAYQVGALRALIPYFKKNTATDAGKISTIIGSSVGAVNGLIFGACLKEGVETAVSEMEELWAKRNFRNTFSGSPSMAFMRAIRMAVTQYLSPGPKETNRAIFNPSPLIGELNSVLEKYGGTNPQTRLQTLRSIAVMTTVEGKERKPLLFLSAIQKPDPERLKGATFDISYVDNLSAKHGFASAALPSVLPPVELDTEHGKVTLVDGGISQNTPVDPAVRLGAERIILLDISGRDWWHDRYGEAHDTKPTWEVPAGADTFCYMPPEIFVLRCKKPLGPILKESVAFSTKKFMSAVGPVWPVFSLLQKKLGQEIAYETMTYVALDRDYIMALMERGFQETTDKLKLYDEIRFKAMK